MKKVWLWGLFVLLLFGGAWGTGTVIDRENISLKAGPTEPGEELSIVWVESLMYPKVVKGDRVISLGVRTASGVKAVSALFDFSSDRAALESNDGLSWSGAYKIPKDTGAGIHVVRYQIAGAKGSIQRTVEFLVDNLPGVSRTEPEVSSWPLTVLSTCTAFSGDSNRILYPGQKLTSISKLPWYKVLFEDGKEGWISTASVKEPTEEYYRLGYEAYRGKDFSAAVKHYSKAVAVNPGFVKGYLWLAKSYLARDDLDAAAETVKKGLRVDERDIELRVVANVLAQKFFSKGRGEFRGRRFHEAVAAYRKTVDLKPESSLAWLQLGESLSQIRLANEAREAWKEGLKHDPVNKALRAQLGSETTPLPQVAVSKVAPLIADESLNILRREKTTKGTKIESAIKSVVSLTKSLGNPIAEKGWQIRRRGEKFLVSYICEQSGGALESFDWLVDVDTRQALPHNDNARLLMSRW